MRGDGTRLWDDEGNEYLLDFLTGISVAQLAYPPAVVEAVREQAGRLMHVGNLFYGAGHELRRLLGSVAWRACFLCNSGAEAIECALKIARSGGPAATSW